MSYLPSDAFVELQQVQRELDQTEGQIDELETMIGELPAIFERKFDQRLQPLLEQERQLRNRNLLLRDRLHQALPAAAPEPTDPASEAPASTGETAAAGGQERSDAASRDGGSPRRAVAVELPPLQRAAAPLGRPAALGGLVARRRRHRPGVLARWRRRRQGRLATAAGRLPSRSLPSRPLALALAGGLLLGLGIPLVLRSGLLARLGPGGPQNPLLLRRPSPSAQAPAAVRQLHLRLASPSWIEVRDHRGRVLKAAILAGDHSFPLGQGLRVNAGRPEVVRMSLDGGSYRALPSLRWWDWQRFTPTGHADAVTAATP